MTFNVWTFLFEIVNFLVLAFVLHRLLYRPLRKAVDDRKAANDKARSEADAARREADALQEKLTAKLADTDRERSEILRQAAEQARNEESKREAESQTAAASVLDRARQDATRLREDTIEELQSELGRIAIAFSGRLLSQACDANLTSQLARRLASDLRQVVGEKRDEVRRNTSSGDAIVESTDALDDSARGDLADAVRELLGREPVIHFQVKPELVGGALLRVDGYVWDATFSAQLEAAAHAVSKGENEPQR